MIPMVRRAIDLGDRRGERVRDPRDRRRQRPALGIARLVRPADNPNSLGVLAGGPPLAQPGGPPELAFSIFDSQQVPGTGRGVYASAVAVKVPENEIDAGIAIFADASRRAGMEREWTRADVETPARLRLYRASVGELFVLSSQDERIKVRL